jgi:secondary thiamine-phosphate synthase enzyme
MLAGYWLLATGALLPSEYGMFQRTLSFHTRGRDTTDVTAEVARVVAASGVATGLCTVFVQHTTASLVLCENADPDVRRDLETLFARLAPDGDPAWRHDTEGPDDMASHARSILAGSSLTVPVAGGRLALGTWQGIYLWEHRHAPHERHVVVTVAGGTAGQDEVRSQKDEG